MSPIKSILLHLDASPRSAVRLDVARQLALRHEAAVTGLFGVTSNFVEMPFAAALGRISWRTASITSRKLTGAM